MFIVTDGFFKFAFFRAIILSIIKDEFSGIIMFPEVKSVVEPDCAEANFFL